MENFIKNDKQKQLDDKMQKGYEYLEKGDSVAACHKWNEVWKDFVNIMDSNDLKYMEDVDEAFKGIQCIYNWASDFEMELGNASNKDSSFARMRIDFCVEYVNRYKDQKEPNLSCMKRAIAESYFKLGKRDQGEQAFQKYLAESPEWGWGWIGWSDQYWLFGENKDKDSDKAINILKKALEVDGLEDRMDVFERLKDIYNDLGMSEEADAIIIDREMPGIPLSKFKDMAMLGKMENYKALANLGLAIETARKTKVGRNDPCPCGSGKKYKKCCLR